MAPALIGTEHDHRAAPRLPLPWWRRRRTILLGAFLLVATLTAAVLAADVLRDFRNAELAALEGQAETAGALARAAELAVARYVAVARSAHEAFETPLGSQGRRRLLARLRRAHPEVIGVSLLDPRGVVIDADPPAPVGLDLSGRRYFQRLLAGADTAAGDVLTGRLPEPVRVLPVAAASRAADGALRGVVVLALVPAALERELRVVLVGDAYPVLVDRDGRAIVHGAADGRAENVPDFRAVPIVLAALAGRPARHSGFTDPLTGVEVLGAMAPVEGLGWAAGAMRPTASALAAARWEVVAGAGAVGAVFVLSLLLALALSGRLARPIAALADGARAIADGRLEHRIHDAPPNELGWLAHQFNVMAAALEEARRQQWALADELTASNRDLQANAARMAQTIAELEAAQERIRELNCDLGAANERLRESEAHLHLALEAGRMGTWDWRLDAGTVTWSPGLEAIHGIPPGTFAGTFEAFLADIHPDDYERVTREIDEAAAGRRPHEMEYRIVLPDGSERWVEGRGRVQRDADGRVVGMTGVCADITERKRAELALRAREAQFRSLSTCSPVGIFVTDMAGRCTYVNPSCEAICGFTEAEALGDGWARFVHPADRDRVLKEWTEATRVGREYAAESRFVRRDGRVRLVQMRAAPMRSEAGAPTGHVGTVEDVTERADLLARETAARAEAEAARRRATFLAGVSAGLAGSLDYETTLANVARIAVPDLADHAILDLLEADGAIRRVAVVDADPAREELARRLQRHPPDPAGAHPIVAALRTGRPVLLGEESDAWMEGADVHPECVEVVRQLGARSTVIVPLVARDRVLGCLTLACAGSGRRFGQDDVDLAEELARRAALAVDNARLYQDAQAAVRAREIFLARASHELRTPLTSALGSVRLLPRAMHGELKEPVEELVETARRNLETMLALINDLLDASKLAAGQEPLTLQPVAVDAVVRESLHVVGAQAREKGVRLETLVPEELRITADGVKLEQVLVNLLANAIKFTPAGGTVRVEAETAGGDALMRVRDTGEGISREHLEAIFEPFFQVSRKATRRQRGTGLGLAICRQIVALHGGRIWAESEGAGRGSTFVVRLPARSPDRRAA